MLYKYPSNAPQPFIENESQQKISEIDNQFFCISVDVNKLSTKFSIVNKKISAQEAELRSTNQKLNNLSQSFNLFQKQQQGFNEFIRNEEMKVQQKISNYLQNKYIKVLEECIENKMNKLLRTLTTDLTDKKQQILGLNSINHQAGQKLGQSQQNIQRSTQLKGNAGKVLNNQNSIKNEYIKCLTSIFSQFNSKILGIQNQQEQLLQKVLKNSDNIENLAKKSKELNRKCSINRIQNQQLKINYYEQAQNLTINDRMMKSYSGQAFLPTNIIKNQREGRHTMLKTKPILVQQRKGTKGKPEQKLQECDEQSYSSSESTSKEDVFNENKNVVNEIQNNLKKLDQKVNKLESMFFSLQKLQYNQLSNQIIVASQKNSILSNKIDKTIRQMNQLKNCLRKQQQNKSETKIVQQMKNYVKWVAKNIQMKANDKCTIQNLQEMKKQIFGKINILHQNLVQKADKSETKKAFTFLQTKIKQIIVLIASEQSQQRVSALMKTASKCLSCDKQVNINIDRGERAKNVSASGHRGSLENQQKNKNLYRNNSFFTSIHKNTKINAMTSKVRMKYRQQSKNNRTLEYQTDKQN